MWNGLSRILQLLPFKKPTATNFPNSPPQKDSAKALFELGKNDEAFALIKKDLSRNPHDKDLHRLLIDKLEESNRLEDLESFYKEVTQMIDDPGAVSCFYSTNAEVLLDKKMFPQALLAYAKAMKGDSAMGYDLCCRYAEVLQHEGRYEEALVQFEKIKNGPSLNEGGFPIWAMYFEGRARSGVAFMNYCLGRVQQAKEEFEYLLANRERFNTNLPKARYLLVLYHLDADEEVMKHYKKHEFGRFLSDWEEWIRFYEQELKITQKILGRGDIDENMRKFNAKKLEALIALLPFLREKVKDAEQFAFW